ncbi:MAG: carboxypeptidase-like regulatory domain-containing protein, partial [Acidobacteriota bacterium]|nr:carboxypeptidase-like regulatory domain-containing protein [Acidobacteriota bacterium]
MAAVCVALLAGSALAQYQTGNIYGKVQAKDGSVLPGVTVTLTGIGAPQVNITDGQGLFRFINLSPGDYTLRADLSGYGAATRSGVHVAVSQSADVTITMNPSVSESITVTAEAPLLDARKTGTGTSVARVELEKIPSSRDPWTVLQSVPSVMVDRINVGGSQSGQQSVYIAKGALGRDNSWNMDGVNITDMGATGSSPLYFDFDSFEEMQITTGGSDPRIQTPGVQLNLVTKRGTNDFKGTGRYFYTPGSMQAAASVPSEASFYLDKTNRINFVRDYGGEIGGPILKDRLWFWAARGDQKISVQASQSPGQIGAFDNIILRNKNLKLNGQIFSNNSAVAYYTWGDKVRNARDISPTRPFETSYRQAGPVPVYKLEDTQIIGSSLYLTGMWSKVGGGFGLFANGGRGESAPSSWRDSASVWHDSYQTYETKRPQKQYRLDGSKFFDIGRVNNELKFGFGYRNTPVNSTTAWPGPA